MNIDTNEPNLLANKQRHKRVFVSKLLFDVKGLFMRTSKKKNQNVFHINRPVEVKDTFGKFMKQMLATGTALLVITSITPSSVLDTGFSADLLNIPEFIEEAEQPPFLMNDEGFVLKYDEPNPAGANQIYTDSIVHTVAPGESCSGIAALYGIRVNTLIWENGMTESCRIRAGQTLVILPHDGVNHIAKKGETIAKIAKDYGVDEKAIAEYNKGITEITVGQKIFIKDGKKKFEEPVYAKSGGITGGKKWSGNTFNTSVVLDDDAEPNSGEPFIWPVADGKGKVTQGYRSGHLAYDIADQAKPDNVAVAAGRIVKAAGGCPTRDVRVEKRCNGGYGNHVILEITLPQPGFGANVKKVQVLYAHMETLYVVEGQEVTQGLHLGKMGSSGFVYGKTGIHLHIELYVDGVKKNLFNFL